MNEALWAFGRATGVVALALFTLAVLLGILTRSGRPLLTLPRFSVTLLHRNVSLLASTFILIHVLALFLDPYAQLTVVDFVVPFLGAFKPLWLGLGTVAFDLLLAVMITSLLRRHVGRRLFRAVHWLSYALWPIALAHSIGNGTDAAEAWFIVFAAVCSATVVTALGWRATRGFVENRADRLNLLQDGARPRSRPDRDLRTIRSGRRA